MNNIINLKNNYKILLISVSKLWRYSNIGIDQIAGYLRKHNFNLDILYHHKKVNLDEIIANISLEYDLYGFSINSSNYECCLKLANYIKDNKPNSTIIFGGGYPTRYYREIFNNESNIDYIILGDGEVPLEELLIHLISKSPMYTHQNIATLVDMESKQPFCNKEINYLPAFDYYENDIISKNQRKEYCIQTKNNICTGKCSFCTERKGSILYKDITNIINEIKYVSKRFGIKKFFFTDDNILDPNNDIAKQRIYTLCNEIKKLNLNLVFKCYVKANSFNDTEEDNRLLELMSETGFKTIFVGIESGNQQDLTLYNKLTIVEDNYRILKLLKKYKIATQIGFINLNPYSTLKTIKENYFFLTNIEMDNLFMYVCSYLRVYKYTCIYERMQKDNLLIDEYNYLDDKSLYNFVDSETKKIFDFIQINMINRVRNLDFEFDWLYSFFLECKKINPQAEIFDDEFEYLRKIQLEKIKDFFYILFVDNNFEESQKQVNEFLLFFENLQPQLLKLHRNLLKMYTEQ